MLFFSNSVVKAFDIVKLWS